MAVNAKLSDLQAAATLDGGELIYVVKGGNSRQYEIKAIGAALLGDTGQTQARGTLGISSAGTKDTGYFLADAGKGDTGDVILWTPAGGAGEGPKLPGGAGIGGVLVDTGTAQTLSGKTLSGSSIADTGVQLAVYFSGGVGADTGTVLRGDGNWRKITLANASDTGKYLADSGAFLSDTIVTTYIRTLLDDTGQTTARTTLGVGPNDSPTFLTPGVTTNLGIGVAAATGGGATAILAKAASGNRVYIAPTDKAGSYQFSKEFTFDADGDALWTAEGGFKTTGDLDATGTITAPYILNTYRGLKISEFINTTSTTTDQQTQLKNAIDSLFDGNYEGLDLEGRIIGVSSSVQTTADIGSLTQAKVIRNGTISLLSGFTGSYLFDMTGYTTVQKLRFQGVEFRCTSRGDIMKLDGNYVGISFDHCIFAQPSSIGIYDTTAGGHELRLTNCVGFTALSATAPLSRNVFMLDMASADAKVIGGTYAYFETAFIFRNAAQQVMGAHIYQGQSAVMTAAHAPAVLFTTGEVGPSYIVGCYIDNASIRLSNQDATTNDLGGLVIVGNNMLHNTSNTSNALFELEPHAANTKVRGLVIDCNTCANNNATTIDPTRQITTSGDVDELDINGFYMRDNIFDGRYSRRANPMEGIFTRGDTGTQNPIIFTSVIPFGNFRINSAVAGLPKGMSSIVAAQIGNINRATDTVRIDTASAVTAGEFRCIASVNTDESMI